MKKLTYLIMTVVVVGLATRFVFAEEMKGPLKGNGMEGKGMMMGKEMRGDGMMDGGMMKMMKMMHMHGMMMRSSTMVSSNDGGVIVLSGNKLYKYDKNLKLVGEAEVKMEKDGMGMGMMKNCPMMGNDDDDEDSADEQSTGSNDQPQGSNHESHH